MRPRDVAEAAAGRVRDLAELTEARAADGPADLAGHAELYRRDAGWIRVRVGRF